MSKIFTRTLLAATMLSLALPSLVVGQAAAAPAPGTKVGIINMQTARLLGIAVPPTLLCMTTEASQGEVATQVGRSSPNDMSNASRELIRSVAQR